MNRNYWLLIIIMIAVVGCGSSEPCSVQSADYFYAVDRIKSKFLKIASDPFLDDYEVIDEVELLRDEVKKLDAPGCVREVQRNLVKFFDAAIAGAKAEVLGDSSRAEELQEEASDYLHEVTMWMEELELDE